MHFDPVASPQQSSSISSRHIAPPEDDFVDSEIEQESEEPAPRSREGLPPAFRMRHERHYVEQVMGEAPLRTVRELAVEEIEPSTDGGIDVQDLERSIRELGVLEPLLVTQQGRQYRVIAGMNRLRAARNAGLRTVPCLVHDVDDDMLKNMRQAATTRAAAPATPEAKPPEPPSDGLLHPAFSGITQGLGFVSALLPAIDAAGDDRFRWAVLTDLAAVELTRARTVAACAEALMNGRALERLNESASEIAHRVRAAVAPEARLRGVRLDLSLAEPDYRVALDGKLVTTALTGVAHSLLALVSGPGVLRIAFRGTTQRPALIVDATQEEAALSDEDVRRFFDGEWSGHPAGASGALMLAGALRVARLHGGRADVRVLDPKGCTLTFVVPRPLTDR
ncbi:MAG TPA: ParB N-terminal domain-containing protein [Vicinamibacterales bacterium]|nr:ParB N-terminal domain-containing protein [Vicinamibacterales bacterium]